MTSPLSYADVVKQPAPAEPLMVNAFVALRAHPPNETSWLPMAVRWRRSRLQTECDKGNAVICATLDAATALCRERNIVEVRRYYADGIPFFDI